MLLKRLFHLVGPIIQFEKNDNFPEIIFELTLPHLLLKNKASNVRMIYQVSRRDFDES